MNDFLESIEICPYCGLIQEGSIQDIIMYGCVNESCPDEEEEDLN